MTYRRYLAATCAALFVSAPAFAQDDVQPQAESVSSGDIVVTARRRDEALQDVPISVSAISGEQLSRSGVTDVQGLQYRTPSLSITSAQSQRNTVAFCCAASARRKPSFSPTRRSAPILLKWCSRAPMASATAFTI